MLTTLSKPKYNDSQIKACPMETSSKPDVLFKKLNIIKLKSCPALIPDLIHCKIAALTRVYSALFPKPY
jgi:hypothetical protein